MFFRRVRTRELTFEDRLQRAVEAGFKVEKDTGGRARIVRGGCAAQVNGGIERAGVLIGHEIALLIDAGFQKFWRTGTTKVPATAAQLKALHAFEEDLKEALGLESLYNQSLGTVNGLHLYDRVENRDHGVPKRAWEA